MSEPPSPVTWTCDFHAIPIGHRKDSEFVLKAIVLIATDQGEFTATQYGEFAEHLSRVLDVCA